MVPTTGLSVGLTRSTGELLRHGRQLLESVLFRKNTDITNTLPRQKGRADTKATDKTDARNVNVGIPPTHTVVPPPPGAAVAAAVPPPGAAVAAAVPRAWSGGLGAYLARTTTRTLAAELRRRAALQFGTRTPVMGRAYGPRTPLFAFVGLGLFGGLSESEQGKGEGFQEEDFSQVCRQIKELFKPTHPMRPSNQSDITEFQLKNYQFGPLIAKGCNSAVYSARLDVPTSQEVTDGNNSQNNPTEPLGGKAPPAFDTIAEDTDDDDDISSHTDQSTSSSSFIVISDPDVDDVMRISYPSFTGSDITILDEDEEDMDLGSDDECLSEEDSGNEQDLCPDSSFPLAVKMMFNYDAESNASAIFRTMQNEAVPAKTADIYSPMTHWDNGTNVKKKRLKPHPNIVDMLGVFVDDVPQMPDALKEYPDALPQRLYPDGCGRNKTMFIVMKRYGVTLREYLAENLPTGRESTVLFSQLMEALLHMSTQGIAHRDLKSDNILLDGDTDCPHLVVTDFGCCLADVNVGLLVPYVSDGVTRGGNGSLMAPEIATARPGRGCYLDYRKSDMWAAGTLVYELFGAENPFYSSSCRNRKRLDSRMYCSKTLPQLPVHAPRYMYRIMRSMLRWKPSKRPSMRVVANALHLLLWGPAEWRYSLELKGPAPSKVEVIRWLVSFTTGVMVERAAQQPEVGQQVEHVLQCQFLARLQFDDVMSTVDYLWHLN